MRILVLALLLAPLAGAQSEPFRVGLSTDVAPAAYLVGNETFGGYGTDMMILGALKLGVELEFVPYTGLEEGVALLRDGHVDAVGVMGPRADLLAFATMNEPWAWPTVVLMTHDGHDWTHLGDATGKISTLPGSPLEAIIQDQFGHMEYVVTENAAEGAKALANQSLDAYLGPLAIVGHQIQEHRLDGLRPVAQAVSVVEAGFWAAEPGHIATVDAIRAAVTDDEARVLYVKWTGFDLSEPRPLDSGLPSWFQPAAISGLVALALLALGVWLQRNQVRRVQAELLAQQEHARAEQARAELEAVERMSRFRHALIDRTAHELATPMTTLSTAVAGLKVRGGVDATMDAMERNLDRLAQTVRNLAKVAAAKPTEHAHPPQPLAPILEELQAHYDPLASERGIQFHVGASEGSVLVREQSLREALGAFLDNALEHAESTISLHVHAEADRIRVRVADDGPGLEEADVDSVWEPYERLANTGLGAGRGMGLYMAKLAIEVDGGRVGCEPGPGGAFWLDLPA